MLPDLEIKVLFCYSPEVLANTYRDLSQLKSDNQELCQILEDIFQNNIITYNVSVLMVDNIEVKELQTQWCLHFPSLTPTQLNYLVKSPSSQSWYKRLKFGSLPQDLLELQNNAFATVVVLETVIQDSSIVGVSAKIGITNSQEAFIGIGRSLNIKGQLTCVLDKILLAHECGHLMGCRHPRGVGGRGFDNTPGNNHGHCLLDTSGNIVAGTIMSYARDAILYYSNPNIFKYPAPYQNMPCGVVGESEAYKTVNNNVQKLVGIFTP
ncbi:Zinc-dependent metalloprotease family protein [Candidatus Hepatincola sp. Av]